MQATRYFVVQVNPSNFSADKPNCPLSSLQWTRFRYTQAPLVSFRQKNYEMQLYSIVAGQSAAQCSSVQLCAAQCSPGHVYGVTSL